MVKIKKKTPTTLAELFQDTATEDLTVYAEILGFNQNGEMDRMKPYEMRRYLAKQILQNPVQVLNHMSEEDFFLMEQLVDAGPNMSAVFYSTGVHPLCVTLGLIDCHIEIEENKDYCTMTDDLRQAIGPHLDNAMKDFDNRLRILMERHLIGALNIYGCCTETELKALLKEYYELEDDGTGLFEHIYPNSAALQLCCFEDEEHDETLYISPFSFSYGQVLAEREEHPEIRRLKHFDKEEVKEAGGVLIPTIPNPYKEKLVESLQSILDYTEQEAILIRLSVWLLLQNLDGPDAVIKNLQQAEPRITQVMPVLIDYLNHLPQWRLSGHSAADLAKMRDTPGLPEHVPGLPDGS